MADLRELRAPAAGVSGSGCSITMNIQLVSGDLLDQKVEVIVNAWNRNLIPWWLLWPHGVSGAIKKRGGTAPFRELGYAPLPLGQSRLTSAGRLPFKGVIHVAGIDGLWRASETSIRGSVQSALQVCREQGFASVAFPVIGAGAGGFNQKSALDVMSDEFSKLQFQTRVVVVRFDK